MDEKYCYLDRCQHGNAVVIMADDPAYAKDNAKEISQLIRNGNRIERLSKGEGCKQFSATYPCETCMADRKAKRKRKKVAA